MLACIFGRWAHAGEKSLVVNLAAMCKDLARKIDECGASAGLFWTAAKSTYNIYSAPGRDARYVKETPKAEWQQSGSRLDWYTETLPCQHLAILGLLHQLRPLVDCWFRGHNADSKSVR